MRRVVLLLVPLLPVRWAAAQAVQGRVVTTDSAMVPGAVVTVFDSAGVPRVAALADDSGRFSLRLPSAGRYRVEVSRIGAVSSVDSTLRLLAGETATRTIVARGAPVALPDEQRETPEVCLGPGARSPGQLVWAQARTALLATQLTRLTRGYTMDVEALVRREPADRRRQATIDRSPIVGTPLRPLTSVPPQELADSGYVSHTPTGDRYQAPHEDVLLSDAFAATHCVKLLPYEPGATIVRLGFEPVPGRTLPEVHGTITLDRRTLELRRVEFGYVNLAQAGAGSEVTGEIVYRRLPDATWITSSWLLTQSIAEAYVPPRPLVAGHFGDPPRARPAIVSGVSHLVTGGTVTRIRARDAVVWTNPDAPD